MMGESLTKEDVQDALRAALAETLTPDHAEHHRFLSEWIERERNKRMNRQRVKNHVIGWGVITAISGAGLAIWQAAKRALAE